MDNKTAGTWRSLFRVIRAFAEGSVVAFGFAFAILAVGTPIVLIIRGLHEGLSWLARLVGDPSLLVEALLSISSIAGGVTLTALIIRLLVIWISARSRSRRNGRGFTVDGNSPQVAQASAA